MRLRLVCMLPIIVFALFRGVAQEKKNISVQFSNTPFEEAVAYIEANTAYRFFYRAEQLDELKISATLHNTAVELAIRKILNSTGFSAYIDGTDIFVFRGEPLAETLPEYKNRNKVTRRDTDREEMTDVEKKYKASQKVAELELITVGKSASGKAGSNCIVSGRIVEASSGEPLIGATVFVRAEEKGAATDLDGHFSLALKPGKYLMEANSLSMRPKKFYLQVNGDGNIFVSLEKELVNIHEVTIVGNRDDNVKGIQMGYNRLSAKSMKEIPVVLGEKDILKVAQMLPGVQTSGEGSSGINVRGGTADQNLFYINKMPVYNTSHLFGFFTTFSPDIVNNFSLYKSNIPANFGGRVSSVFDISTRQGNKKEFFGQGGISPVTGHIEVEGPIVKDKSSAVLSYRTTYSNYILKQLEDRDLRKSDASFYDFTAIVNSEIDEKNILKIFAYRSSDDFSLSVTDRYDYSNTGGSLSWKHFFSSSLNLDVAAVSSNYSFGHIDKNNPTSAYDHNYSLNHNEVKADLVLLTDNNHRLLFGGSAVLFGLRRGEIEPFGEESNRMPVDLGQEKGLESALYISDEFKVLPRVTLMAGLRMSMYNQLGPVTVYNYFDGAEKAENNIENVSDYGNNKLVKTYAGPEPRIAFNYLINNNNSLKASYNRTRQYIFMLSNTIALSPTDQWKMVDYHIKPPTADQISIGYYKNAPKQGMSASFELYRKWTRNIVEYKDGADFISPYPLETQVLQGTQDAYGLEAMIKKSTGKLTGWISYCYSRSWVLVDSDIPGESINGGIRYPSNFDKPHSVNFVSNLRASRRLSMSANAVYYTGRPITYPKGSYTSEGMEILTYTERNSNRIPDYFRVDLSVNIEGSLLSQKWIHSYWMLGVYNLTGRKNAYSVYFEMNDGAMQGYKMSIFGQPIVTLSWNYKFGNYASE